MTLSSVQIVSLETFPALVDRQQRAVTTGILEEVYLVSKEQRRYDELPVLRLWKRASISSLRSTKSIHCAIASKSSIDVSRPINQETGLQEMQSS